MKWPLRTFAAVLLMTVALMILARRADSGWIAFASFQDDGAGIFLMTGDGGAVRKVTPSGLCGNVPQWSPDGRWLLFHGGCNPTFELLRIRPNGSSAQFVTNGLPYNGNWSPDGQWVVLARGAPDYDQLHLVDATTSTDRLLVANHAYPQWSPDSAWIYAPPFYVAESSLDRIHVATGRVEQLLPAQQPFPTRLSWSPDGTQIVLGMSQSQGDELYIMSPDGAALQAIPVALPMPRVADPQWSPDGEWIAFLGGEIFTTHQIYRVRPDGSDLERLIQREGRVWNLQWSPDGAWLLFEAEHEGDRDFFRIRADGSSLQHLTPGPGHFSAPQYAPVSGLEWHPMLMILAALGMLVASMLGRFRR